MNVYVLMEFMPDPSADEQAPDSLVAIFSTKEKAMDAVKEAKPNHWRQMWILECEVDRICGEVKVVYDSREGGGT